MRQSLHVRILSGMGRRRAPINPATIDVLKCPGHFLLPSPAAFFRWTSAGRHVMAGREGEGLGDLADAARLRPLDEVAPLLGHVRDPAERSRWHRNGSVLDLTGVRHFDHLQGLGVGSRRRRSSTVSLRTKWRISLYDRSAKFRLTVQSLCAETEPTKQRLGRHHASPPWTWGGL